jgi:hypothetical protein
MVEPVDCAGATVLLDALILYASGCPAAWPGEADRGRLFRNGLHIPANAVTNRRDRP